MTARCEPELIPLGGSGGMLGPFASTRGASGDVRKPDAATLLVRGGLIARFCLRFGFPNWKTGAWIRHRWVPGASDPPYVHQPAIASGSSCWRFGCPLCLVPASGRTATAPRTGATRHSDGHDGWRKRASTGRREPHKGFTRTRFCRPALVFAWPFGCPSCWRHASGMTHPGRADGVLWRIAFESLGAIGALHLAPYCTAVTRSGAIRP